MKNFYRAFWCFAFAVALMFGSFQSAEACDRSEFRLDSITFDGTEYTVYTTICIGAGVLGSAQGGDNNTTSIFFMAWGNPGLLFTSFPPSMTSDTTGCTMNGTLGGAIGGGPLAGVQTRVTYSPASACQYGCVTSTAGCGRPHQDCTPMAFTFNELPDSLRALGIEGTGNPFAGCFRPNDMVIDFTILPVVWASFDAQIVGESVDIEWATVSERNNDYFRVMRSTDGLQWSEIGTVDAIGNSDVRSDYTFVDEQPLQGTNQYKIVQVDQDSRSSESEVVSVNFDIGSKMEWRQVGPIPTADFLDVSFMAPQDESLTFQLVGMDGSILQQRKIDALYGLNKVQLNLSELSSGIYFIRLSGSQGALDRKVIKI